MNANLMNVRTNGECDAFKQARFEQRERDIDFINSCVTTPILKRVALCAEGMNLDWMVVTKNNPEHTIRYLDGTVGSGSIKDYWPIANDEQAMALAKEFKLTVDFHGLTAAVT